MVKFDILSPPRPIVTAFDAEAVVLGSRVHAGLKAGSFNDISIDINWPRRV